MGRAPRAAAVLALAALLSGCQTTGSEPPSGAVTGAVTGAAAGAGAQAGIRIASGGHTGNPLVGLLAGALVGAIVGTYVTGQPAGPEPIPALSEADQALADRAVAESAEAGIGRRIRWTSQTDGGVSGWTEAYPVDEPVVGRECREIRMYYDFPDTPRVEAKVYCREGERWVQAPMAPPSEG